MEHPEGYLSPTLFCGSGSSQAAAVVSGAVALLLEARPELTPDQVKHLLISTAGPARRDSRVEGHGLVNIAAAASAITPGSEAIQNWPRSDGSGSIEAARGTHHVIIDGTRLEGEVIWTGASWTGASWTGASWTGASWTGASWTGASWS